MAGRIEFSEVFCGCDGSGAGGDYQVVHSVVSWRRVV